MNPTLPKPRDNHLFDAITSRDLFGVVRGACTGCTSCGKYIIETKEKYTSSASQKSQSNRHPDNDLSITHCSRCGCPPEAHAVVAHETNRELGNDAFALQEWDSAVLHYTRAIEAHSVDATLWSNRAAAYLAKGWHAQALHDAERALSLRPTWYRGWSRKGAALMGLGKPEQAEEAYKTALQHAEGSERAGLERAMKDAKAAASAAVRRRSANRTTAAGVASQKPENNNTASTHPLPTKKVPINISASRAHVPPVQNAPASEYEGLSSPASPSSTAASVQELWSAAQQQYARVTAEMDIFAQLMVQIQTKVEEGTHSRPGIEIDSAVHVPAANEDKQQPPSASSESALEEIPLPSETSISGSIPEEESPRKSGSKSSDTETFCSEADGMQHDEKEDGKVESITHTRSMDSSDGEHRGEESRVNDDDASHNASDNSSDSDADDWVAAVAAAREQMGAHGAAGFVPPPPSAHTRSRPVEESPSSSAPSASTTSKLSLNSLQSMLLAAAVKRLAMDPMGVERVACKACQVCRQYKRVERDVGFGIEIPHTGGGVSSSLENSAHQKSRQCATCGCDCSRHETEAEAAARQAQAQRAQQRQERFRKLRDQSSLETSKAPQSEREQRIAAAKERKAAAKASGDPLLSTDADVLTHSRRSTCSECREACPGFRIDYRTIDANDPEVMFYCSLCGCRAESHDIDAVWQKEEEGLRKAEEAAAAARAARSRTAAPSAALASRREEAEAYAALGLHFGADAKAVTRAYKKLALKLHPDKLRRQSSGEGDHGENSEAHEFMRVTKAYAFLNGRRI